MDCDAESAACRREKVNATLWIIWAENFLGERAESKRSGIN
jgi:hypothetical protein